MDNKMNRPTARFLAIAQLAGLDFDDTRFLANALQANQFKGMSRNRVCEIFSRFVPRPMAAGLSWASVDPCYVKSNFTRLNWRQVERWLAEGDQQEPEPLWMAFFREPKVAVSESVRRLARDLNTRDDRFNDLFHDEIGEQGWKAPERV